MDKSPICIVTGFVLERVVNEPLQQRAEIYRALAQLSPDAGERKTLNALAAECVEIERRHRQLVLDFKRSAL